MGKSFALLTSNECHRVARVRLDLKLVEAEQVASPMLNLDRQRDISTGSNSTPTEILSITTCFEVIPVTRESPSMKPTTRFQSSAMSFTTFATSDLARFAAFPDITPALPLFAQLRRFTLAVLAAAETAADFAGILYTDAPANGEADSAEPFEPIELEKRMLLTMPGGWKMAQMRAEQPSTTYGEFKKEILNEIARCLSMPYNVAAGNSSGYNYASGRLDHQTYYKSIRVEQSQLARVVLDRILQAWLREAVSDRRLSPQLTPHARFYLRASMVLGRTRARRSGQGSQRPENPPCQSYDYSGP